MGVGWRITDGQSQRRSKNFYERMTRIPPAVKKRINAANEKSAEDLAAMMVRLAPRDQGDLIASIRYYEMAGVEGGGIVWRVSAGNDKAFQARWIEFGTPKMRAQAFFYPSIRALRRLIRRRQQAAWRKGIQETKK